MIGLIRRRKKKSSKIHLAAETVQSSLYCQPKHLLWLLARRWRHNMRYNRHSAASPLTSAFSSYDRADCHCCDGRVSYPDWYYYCYRWLIAFR